MSQNNKRGGRGGRQTRSSSRNSQAGGSRPISPENQFTFSAPKDTVILLLIMRVFGKLIRKSRNQFLIKK